MRSILSLIAVLLTVGVALSDPSAHASGFSLSEDGTVANNAHRQLFSGGTLPTLPQVDHTLNATCSNQLCQVFETALTCKALGINFQKTCAQYFLGYLYSCPIFPAPSEIFNAPYACIEEIKSLVPAGGLGSSPLGNIQAYLMSSMATNCQRRCYQRYIQQTTTFFSSCHTELTTKGVNFSTNYPIASLLESYGDLRNQVCAQQKRIPEPIPTPLGTISLPGNCYDGVTYLTNIGKILNPNNPNPTTIDIFNPVCDYGFGAGGNPIILSLAGTAFEAMTCCIGNQASMLSQNQHNASDVLLMPPCLLRYMRVNNRVDPNTFCTIGANGNITTVEFTMNITGTVGNPPYTALNVYSLTTILNMQGYITKTITTLNPALANYPYGLNYLQPLKVEIVNYDFFSAGGEQLTASNGLQNATSPTWDYLHGKKVMLTVLVVVEGLDSLAQAKAISGAISSPNFPAVMKGVLGTVPMGSTVTVANVLIKEFGADPFILPNAGVSSLFSVSKVSSILLFSVIGLVSLLTVTMF